LEVKIKKEKKKTQKENGQAGLCYSGGIICWKPSLMPEGMIHLTFISGKFTLPVLTQQSSNVDPNFIQIQCTRSLCIGVQRMTRQPLEVEK
jgi:hypothetical protein